MGWFQTDENVLWLWYTIMCVLACFNLGLCAWFWFKLQAHDRYGHVMKCLAIPWVFECAYRSFFPSLYLQRYVFWDTCFNSIIVDRTFACVGELCWCTQFAMALCFVDVSINQKPSTWIQISGVAAVIIYVFAECTSYYNVATTNELWCAVEVLLDGLSFLCMAPGAIYLFCKCPGHIHSSTAKMFLAITSVLCVVYPCYNVFSDAPMYMARYRQDQADHKQYFSFVQGLVDAAQRRVVAHTLSQWKEDMVWMTAYFSFGSLSGILLMVAPRLGQRGIYQNLPDGRDEQVLELPLAEDAGAVCSYDQL